MVVNHRPARWVVAVAAVAFARAAPAQTGCAETWTPGLSPLRDPNATVACVATVDLGSGPELVINGPNITRVGDVFVSRTARLVGSTWIPVGPPTAASPDLYHAYAFAAFDDGSGGGPKLYAAGRFNVPGSPASEDWVGRWDGTSWTLLGVSPASHAIRVLKVVDFGSGPTLVAAGQFQSIGGALAPLVARWNGMTWLQVGSLNWLAMLHVTSLEVYDSGAGPQLYAGTTPTPFAPPGSSLQRFNGTSWVAAGGAAPNYVTALRAYSDPQLGSVLVVAGLYPVGVLAPLPASIGFFNGSAYTYGGFAPGANGFTGVDSITSFDDGSGPALYYAGSFTGMTLSSSPSPNFVAAMHVIRYQNGALTPLGAGLPGSSATINDLVVFPHQGAPTLVAGGDFFASSTYLARFDGSLWTGLTPGFPHNGEIGAAVPFDDGTGLKLYVGGSFQGIGSSPASNFARWNGSSWEGIGAPLDVRAMVVHDDGTGPALYLAGSATFASPQPTMMVARWNGGTSFTPLGAGLTGTVWAMRVWDDGTGPALWVGGRSAFSQAFLARRTGAGWQTLNQIAGIGGPQGTSFSPSAVYALTAIPGFGLLVSGSFPRFGDVTVSNIALLHPDYSVDTLGAGVTFGPVGATAIFDDGTGPTIWAQTAGAIYRFDTTTSTWPLAHPVLQGGGGTLLRALPYGNGMALYAGNYSLGAYFIERYDGTTWSTVATGGLDLWVNDVLAYDDGAGWGLWAIGRFKTAGTMPSGGVGRVGMGAPTILAGPPNQSVALGQPVTLAVTAGGAAQLGYLWSHDGAPIPGANAPAHFIPSATFADAGSYAVQIMNPCGSLTSQSATLAVRGCDLSLTQPGPGVLSVGLSGGPGSAHALTVFSALAANATKPGAGAFLGLHVETADVVAQFLTQAPPFVTTLSPAGSASWSSGALPAQLIGLTIWGVSTLYDPATSALIGAPSFIAHRHIL